MMYAGHFSWSLSDHGGSIHWDVHKMFSRSSNASLFVKLFHERDCSVMPITPSNLAPTVYAGLYAMFIPYHSGSIVTWLVQMVDLINTLTSGHQSLKQASLWVPREFLTLPLSPQFTECLDSLGDCWLYTPVSYSSANYGDYVSAERFCLQLFHKQDAGLVNCHRYESQDPYPNHGYGQHIDK